MPVHGAATAVPLAFLGGAARKQFTPPDLGKIAPWAAKRHEPRSATIILRIHAQGGRNQHDSKNCTAIIRGRALIAFTALNAYLAINRLRLIQKSAALTLESSMIHANISGALQDLTDMETGSARILVNRGPCLLKSLY